MRGEGLSVLSFDSVLERNVASCLSLFASICLPIDNVLNPLHLLLSHRVLEVTAETTAPELTVKELLQAASGIKSDVTVEAQSAARAASKVCLCV